MLLQALESKVLLDTAMSLYGLEHSELYWEKAQVIVLLDHKFRQLHNHSRRVCCISTCNMYTIPTLSYLCGDMQDTKLLVSWSDDTIVIAFRGTSSMANALADLQVTSPLPASVL